MIFTLAIAEGFIEGHRNPMNKIAKLEEVPKLKRRLNHEDEEKILKACLLLKLDYVANATVCRTAGVKGFWFRWLRDEAENRWREAGMHPLDIAHLMGHASPRTTMIYNNPRPEEIVRQMSAANPSKILPKTSRAVIADRS